MSKAAELANLIGNINAGGGGVNRNFIINGAMNVAQRGTSLAAVANNDYTLDKFQFTYSQDGAFTVTQDSSSPDGFANSLKVDVTTADTSLATSHYLVMEHKIEAQNLQQLQFGKSGAKNITLSFYVKSNKTGTYAVNIIQSDNSSKMANLTYTIDSADTWERKSLTFTGDTSGVINDDNGIGLKATFSLSLGSNWTSGDTSASFRTFVAGNYGAGQAVNILDSTSNEWLITGVQLEIGQNPTEFEHEPVERTLTKCLRYFHRLDTSTSDFLAFSAGGAYGSTTALTEFKPIVPMRIEPTLGTNGLNSNNFVIVTAATTTSISSIAVTGSNDAIRLNATSTSSMTVGDYAYLQLNDDNYLEFIAEL
jgi:hypothetical protein